MYQVEVATPDKTGWVVWIDGITESNAKSIAKKLRAQNYIARTTQMM